MTLIRTTAHLYPEFNRSVFTSLLSLSACALKALLAHADTKQSFRFFVSHPVPPSSISFFHISVANRPSCLCFRTRCACFLTESCFSNLFQLLVELLSPIYSFYLQIRVLSVLSCVVKLFVFLNLFCCNQQNLFFFVAHFLQPSCPFQSLFFQIFVPKKVSSPENRILTVCFPPLQINSCCEFFSTNIYITSHHTYTTSSYRPFILLTFKKGLPQCLFHTHALYC